jgi:PAS domain S-box-containing protein
MKSVNCGGQSTTVAEHYTEENTQATSAAGDGALKMFADVKFALDERVMVATTDVRGTITYANDKFCATSKYSRKELLGKNHRILSSGSHSKEYFRQMYQTIASGQAWRGEICNRAKDGSIYWADTTIVLLLDPSGKPFQYAAISIEIAEPRQTEATSERLAAIVEGCHDAIIGEDLNGKITEWNRGAEEVFWYTAAEVIGKSIHVLIPPDRASEESEILQFVRREESVEHFETARVRKDGERIDVSVTISPIRGKNGGIIGASEIARDITERKRTEGALRESEASFRALVNLVPGFVWICTNDGLNIYFSDRWFRYTGLTPKQSYGKGWNTPFHPDDKKAAWEAWNRATATGESYRIESRLRAADGSYRWFLMLGDPLRDAAGRVSKWFGTFTDIGEQKNAETELRTLSEQFRELSIRLQQIREDERTIVARDLHDQIGQILTAIKMDVDWVLKRPPKSKPEIRTRLRATLDLVRDATDSLRSICTRLRPGVLDDLGLAAAIEWQAKDFASRAGIQCDASVSTEDLDLDSDRSTAIFRILQEALTNVARHAKAKVVRISLRREPSRVLLVVQDDGIGILDSELTVMKRSLGILGMRERAHACGGELQIWGDKGKGTTVAVDIPCVDRQKELAYENSASG